MQPKPDFLGDEIATAFQDADVAVAYQHRPPYPPAVFDILATLVVDQPRHVLDVGCGTGFLARHLVERVERVDAVDISHAMIEQGQRLPGGDHPRLTWIVGSAEDAALRPPYALIVAGDSLHWMDWSVVLPRFAGMLTPHGYLAILGVDHLPTPWDEALWPLRQRYSAIPNWQYYDLVAGLEERGLFRRVGTQRTAPVRFTQLLATYVESFHGRAAFARARMDPAVATEFDAQVRATVAPYCHDGETVALQLVTDVVWGTPLTLSGSPTSKSPRDC
jgi:SAM-dependent methyltransferase